MYKTPDLSLWTGRDDPEDGLDALRYHHVLSVCDLNEKTCPSVDTGLLSVDTELGRVRNKGRIGAAEGPGMIRKYLGNLGWHHGTQTLVDAGQIMPADDDLEQLQAEQSMYVRQLLQRCRRVVVLGGGHEIAWGNYLAMTQQFAEARLGVLNIDAHFDNRRPVHGSTSGTSFFQMYEHAAAQNHEASILTLGIQPTQNTKALFKRAEDFGHRYHTADDIRRWGLEGCINHLVTWAGQVDVIYLTVCLDALDSAVMPAVSAPCTHGLTLNEVCAILRPIKASGKLKLTDFAEYSPRLDLDHRGARVVAYLVDQVI